MTVFVYKQLLCPLNHDDMSGAKAQSSLSEQRLGEEIQVCPSFCGENMHEKVTALGDHQFQLAEKVLDQPSSEPMIQY